MPSKDTEVKLITEEWTDEAFANPKGAFYIRNAFGDIVWILTRIRSKAQLVVDTEYGIGKYIVRPVAGSKGAESVTVRAVATRKGQYVQSQRARILNG